MLSNVDRLLQGCILVKELSPPSPTRRVWIEVALHDDDVPAYPLRTPPYSMTSTSPFKQRANPESRFKVRASSFDAEEIRQGYDPSYDGVEEYKVIESLQRLKAYLADRGVAIDDLVESSLTDYPL